MADSKHLSSIVWSIRVNHNFGLGPKKKKEEKKKRPEMVKRWRFQEAETERAILNRDLSELDMLFTWSETPEKFPFWQRMFTKYKDKTISIAEMNHTVQILKEMLQEYREVKNAGLLTP